MKRASTIIIGMLTITTLLIVVANQLAEALS